MSNGAVVIKSKHTKICDHDKNLEHVLHRAKDLFPYVNYFEISKVSELLELLSEARKVDYSDVSILWIFICIEMSGKRIKLDQDISCKVIFDSFIDLCPTLQNKPKVFVLQALEKEDCGGNPLIMDFWKTQNIEIPLPCKPGVLICMHKVKGRSCRKDERYCLFKAFEERLENRTQNTELINFFRLIMSAIKHSKNAPLAPFLYTTITKLTTLEQRPSNEPLDSKEIN